MDDQNNQDSSNQPEAPQTEAVTVPATTSQQPAQEQPTPQPEAQTDEGDKVIQIGKYKVQVIRSLCISAASCVAVSPSTFQLDAENKAVIEAGSTDTPENILMAAQSCPTKAIIITDTETGQQVWPA